MPDNDIELEIAIAEEEAKAKQKARSEQTTPQAPGFLDELAGGKNSTSGNVGQWASDIGNSAVGMVKGAGELLGNAAANYTENPMSQMSPFGAFGAVGKQLYNGVKTPYDAAKRTGELATSVIPGGRTAFDYLGEVGTPQEQTPGAYGKQLRQDLSTAPLALAPQLAGVAGGVETGVRDSILGKPQANLLAEQSVNGDIYANTLNAASKRSAAEDALVQRAESHSDAFTEANPVAGIDPSGGRKSFEQFENNLTGIKSSSLKTRNETIKYASEMESAAASNAASSGVPGGVGVSFDDIPSQITKNDGNSFGLDTIALIHGEDGLAGVQKARQYLAKDFGVQFDPSGQVIAPGRKLSVSELNDTRMRLDGQIRSLGGFDDATAASFGVSPSSRDATVSALSFYRDAVDKALKGRVTDLVGSDAAEAFSKAGEQYGMANTYGELTGRFKRETGQAFAPGSAKAVPGGMGPLGTGGMIDKTLHMVAPDVARARMQTQQLQREGNAIQNLQDLIDYKTGARAMPAPRGWSQIKTNMGHLTNVGTLAMQLGLVNSVEQLANMPDALAKQVVGQTAAAAPMAFVQTPDNVNVIDNKYVNPQDKDLIVQEALNKSPADRAKIIGASFKNEYVPSSPPEAPRTQQAPAPTLPLPQMSSNMNSVLPGGNSGQMVNNPNLEHQSLISKLEKMTAVHANDIQ